MIQTKGHTWIPLLLLFLPIPLAQFGFHMNLDLYLLHVNVDVDSENHVARRNTALVEKLVSIVDLHVSVTVESVVIFIILKKSR